MRRSDRKRRRVKASRPAGEVWENAISVFLTIGPGDCWDVTRCVVLHHKRSNPWCAEGTACSVLLYVPGTTRVA